MDFAAQFSPRVRSTQSNGITMQDIKEHETRSSKSSALLYAPRAASALRGSLAHEPKSESSVDMPRTPALKLQAPISPSSDSSDQGQETARTTLSECCTDMSQMTTPRQPSSLSGSAAAPRSKHTESKDLVPNAAVANRLFHTAELPLGQIDEDTDAELDMYREQQEMIAKMCSLQADAFLAKEKEKEEEKKRENEQMGFMRLEQLQLIRMQEAKKREELIRRRAASAPPVRRPEVYASPPPRPRHQGDIDTLNSSCCTETLSPGLDARVANAAGAREDLFAWDSPTRKVYSPQRELAAAKRNEMPSKLQGRVPEIVKAKPRPKSAFSRFMSSLGTKRLRSSIYPLPKAATIASQIVKGFSLGRSNGERSAAEHTAWASEGIPIVRNPEDAHESD